VRFKRIHLLWLTPLVLICTLLLAGWKFVDALHYGNASSLHRAVMRNDAPRVAKLLAQGEDVNARMRAELIPETWGATPLHLAARRDRTEIVEALLQAGADKNAADDLGFTPLHAALADRADDAAQALIRADVCVRSDTRDGRDGYALENCGQPLRTALERANFTTVRMLLNAGADLQFDVGEDATAYVNGPDRLPKLQLLVERGFSVEGESSWGRPLQLAAQCNDTESISFLLDHGANIEARGGEYAFTPLLAAAYVGSNDSIKLLLKRGANPKVGTDEFGSPIYASAFSAKTETVRLLLSSNLGIDLEAGRASDKATPLHFAYWNNDTEMAELLLKAGARPDARTTDGRLPTQFRK